MGFQNLFSDSKFAPVLNEHPITFFDIGTRGGIDSDLWPIAFGVDVVGFEPDPIECSRLGQSSSGPWRSSKILPFAIGDSVGKRTLHIPLQPEGASLLEPLKGLPAHLYKKQYFDILKTIEVDTVTLDHIVDIGTVSPPECLKIDIEGLELGVLKSSPRVLENLLAVKTEVAFTKLRHQQPIAGEFESFMSEKGFYLMDLIQPAHWRTTGYTVHPHMNSDNIPYSRGQLIQGDYLFLRKFGIKQGSEKLSTVQIVKLAILSMSFGYFDYAADILKHNQANKITFNQDVPDLLWSLGELSRRYGRVVARREFFHHLRLLGPYIRRVQNLILR